MPNGFTTYAMAPAWLAPFDELALAERGEHDHRRNALVSDLFGGTDPVQLGHLDVHDHQIWLEIGGQCYGHFPVPRLADYVIALLREHLHQIKTDEHLILGDHDPCLGRVSDLAVLSSHGDTLARCVLRAGCI